MNKKIARRKRKSVAPRFIFLFMILIVIAIITLSFMSFLKEDKVKNQTIELVPENPSSSTEAVISNKDTVSEKPKESKPSSVENLPKVPYKYAVQVVQSETVDKNYFNDAVFIGDSISLGFKIYNVLPPANVIAERSVHVSSIANDQPVYKTVAGKDITLFNAMKGLKVKPKKIYVLLGTNSLPWLANDEHIGYYEKVIDRLIKEYPEAVIYIQSVTPITKGAEDFYKSKKQDFDNAKVRDFNQKLYDLAKKKKLYYLDIRAVLVDKKGELSTEFVGKGSDGVHFLKNGHKAIYEYYKTHTAFSPPATISR